MYLTPTFWRSQAEDDHSSQTTEPRASLKNGALLCSLQILDQRLRVVPLIEDGKAIWTLVVGISVGGHAHDGVAPGEGAEGCWEISQDERGTTASLLAAEVQLHPTCAGITWCMCDRPCRQPDNSF